MTTDFVESAALRPSADQPSGWRWIFAIALLILAVAGGAAFYSLQRLAAASQRVEHTYEVLGVIDSVMSQLKDAETGHRGFLLTNDAALLSSYEQSAPATLATTSKLRELVADNPDQVERAERFHKLAEVKLQELAKGIEDFRAGRRDQAIGRLAEGRVRRLMDELRRSRG